MLRRKSVSFLQGKGLTDIRSEFYTVLVGNATCSEITVLSTKIICKPPQEEPEGVGGEDRPRVVVSFAFTLHKRIEG